MATLRFCCMAASGLVSLGGALGTIFLLWWADYRGGHGEWPNPYKWLDPEVIVFLLWLISPYVAVAMLACSMRSLVASVLVFSGVVAMAGFGVSMFYGQLSSSFSPPPGKEIMNCAGPIAFVLVPILQLGAGVVLAAAAMTVTWVEDRLLVKES